MWLINRNNTYTAIIALYSGLLGCTQDRITPQVLPSTQEELEKEYLEVLGKDIPYITSVLSEGSWDERKGTIVAFETNYNEYGWAAERTIVEETPQYTLVLSNSAQDLSCYSDPISKLIGTGKSPFFNGLLITLDPSCIKVTYVKENGEMIEKRYDGQILASGYMTKKIGGEGIASLDDCIAMFQEPPPVEFPYWQPFTTLSFQYIPTLQLQSDRELIEEIKAGQQEIEFGQGRFIGAGDIFSVCEYRRVLWEEERNLLKIQKLFEKVENVE